uniref:Uncharacterized protein n=1 Tax=Anguilla anguilla TaxID=7936 RepID=A0A0E9S630_ANGAN
MCEYQNVSENVLCTFTLLSIQMAATVTEVKIYSAVYKYLNNDTVFVVFALYFSALKPCQLYFEVICIHIEPFYM